MVTIGGDAALTTIKGANLDVNRRIRSVPKLTAIKVIAGSFSLSPGA